MISRYGCLIFTVLLISSRIFIPSSVICSIFSISKGSLMLSASTSAKNEPPNEISHIISPKPATLTDTSSLYRKDGTFSILTSTAFPSTTCTLVRMIPLGASRTTCVYGSSTGTMPVSTSIDAVPMLPWPHIFR